MNHIQKYENFLNLFDDKGIGKVLAKNDKIVLDLVEKIKLDWESDKNPNKIEFFLQSLRLKYLLFYLKIVRKVEENLVSLRNRVLKLE